jgi:hypothetical protein
MSVTYSFMSRAARVLAVLLVALAALAVVGVVSPREGTAARTMSLERAHAHNGSGPHAHNDYEHDRPLYDNTLDSGFKSVEADVWLIDGELVVSHDDPRPPTTAQPKGTLESLYLKPLRKRVRANGGNVYAGDRDYFTLIIDIKSEAEPTYRALYRELKKHQRILTTFKRGDVENGAVTAIVSGNRPRETMEGQRTRYAAYDGRIPDDLGNSLQAFMPLVSQNSTSSSPGRASARCPKGSAGSCGRS